MSDEFVTMTGVVPAAFWTGWVEHVTREVNQLPGIQKLSFLLRRKTATIVYDPAKVSEEEIRQALARANASIAKANEPAPAALDLLSPDSNPGPPRPS